MMGSGVRCQVPGVRGQMIALVVILFCGSGLADAGWFVPENRIAWQAWRHGDDAVSLQHWDYSSKGIYGRATVLFKMGHLREAERGFRQALNAAAGLKPDYIASVWYNLGNCLYREGALQQAREAWRQALQYHPGHVKAVHNLALLEGLLKQQRKQAGDNSPASGPAPDRAQHGPRKKQQHGDRRQTAAGSPVGSDNSKPKQVEQGGGEGDMTGMEQAKRAAASVRDSMDVFLKHRLAEKSGNAMPARRGAPW